MNILEIRLSVFGEIFGNDTVLKLIVALLYSDRKFSYNVNSSGVKAV
jgi:hypothetical protein